MIKFSSRSEERSFIDRMIPTSNDCQMYCINAALNFDVALSIIGQHGLGFVSCAEGRPSLTLVCDDSGTSRGPANFPYENLCKFISKADHAFILAWAFEPLFYAGAALVAAHLRRNVIFIETRLKHEQEWITHIDAMNPRIRFEIATPKGGRA